MKIRQRIKSIIKVLCVTIVLSSLTIPAFAYDTTDGFVARDEKSGDLIYVQRQYTDTTQPILDNDGNVRWVDETGDIIMYGWHQGRSLEDPATTKWYYLDDGKALVDGIRKSNGRWFIVKDRYMYTMGGLVSAGSEYPGRYVYALKGGTLYNGLRNIDGYQYYFGAAVNSDGETVPVSAYSEVLYVPDKEGKCLFGTDCKLVDPALDGNRFVLYKMNSELYVVKTGGYVVVNGGITIDGVKYYTDDNGKVISQENVSEISIASDSNATSYEN